MTLLIDNDVVHKLAQLDLLGVATPLLIKEYGNLLVLNTLRYKFCSNRTTNRIKQEKRYGAEIVNRIQLFIDTHAKEIDMEVTDLALIEAMINSEDGLDIGEMQLLQAMLKSTDSSMFTGDKRFLRALAKDENIAVYIDQLEQSFVCFEQIIIFLINKLGFDFVKERYISALNSELEVDTTLRMCFERRENAVKNTVLKNLDINVGYVRNDTLLLLSTSEEWCISLEQEESENSLTLVSESFKRPLT